MDYLGKAHHVALPPNPHVSCVLRITIVFASGLWGILLIMAMTFDRFYGIVKPHKASSVNTVRRAQITCMCIIMFGSIYNIPHIFYSINSGYDCIPYGKAMIHAPGEIYYWLSFIVNYSFPFAALLVMNSFIIHTIRSRKNLTTTDQPNQRAKSSERQIFIILLLVTFSFLILTTPSYMLFLFTMIVDFSQSPRYEAGFRLFYSLSEKTWYTNNGINFFLYILSGTKFRNDLKQLFGCDKVKTSKGFTGGGNSAVTSMSVVSANLSCN